MVKRTVVGIVTFNCIVEVELINEIFPCFLVVMSVAPDINKDFRV